MIGSLLYLILGTRPDIAFAVAKLAQFTSNPSPDHLKKAQYICRYLNGTRDYTLVYDGGSGGGLEGFSDSDWASDAGNGRRSQSGYFFKLADCAVSWTSRAQRSVALSATAAEYISLSECAVQATWFRSLLSEIGYDMKAIPISGDNQGSVFIAQNPVTDGRSKHIDIRYHYVREKVQEDEIALSYIPGTENPADLLTKNLPRIKFNQLWPLFGLKDVSST